jgi:hypothetical protein
MGSEAIRVTIRALLQRIREESMDENSSWSDIQRLEAWAGEARVNLFRLAAIAGFYGHHLINVFLIGDDPSSAGNFHLAVTFLALVWGLAVLVVYVCLSRRWVPPALKYVATAWDLLLITALLAVAGDPKTMLAVLYFLVIAASALRLSLALVYTATLGAMAGYAVFLGYIRFFLEMPASGRLARSQQIVFLLALGAAGILAGQIVRQIRRVAAGYPVTVEEKEE